MTGIFLARLFREADEVPQDQTVLRVQLQYRLRLEHRLRLLQLLLQQELEYFRLKIFLVFQPAVHRQFFRG